MLPVITIEDSEYEIFDNRPNGLFVHDLDKYSGNDTYQIGLDGEEILGCGCNTDGECAHIRAATQWFTEHN